MRDSVLRRSWEHGPQALYARLGADFTLRPHGVSSHLGRGDPGRGHPEQSWVGKEGRVPSGPSLDSRMSPWFEAPQSGEVLPRLSGHLRTRPPAGHLIPASSGQASDPDTLPL